MYTYVSPTQKLKKRPCNLSTLWNSDDFGTILNDFESSTNWAISIQNQFNGLESSKIPGIQPIDSWFLKIINS